MSTGSGSVCCPVCRNELSDGPRLDKNKFHHHLVTDHGYLRCEQCPVVVYVEPSQLESHNQRHHAKSKIVRKRKTELITSRKHKKLKTEDDNGNTDIEIQQPSNSTKNPLSGYFLQTVMECKECPDRPPRLFSFFSSWVIHLKSQHPDLANMNEYKQKHGDPDIVKFKHVCRMCNIEMRLNLTVMKRHLAVKHKTTVVKYLELFREELIEERKKRPIIGSRYSLKGWWEGCLFTCQLCSTTFPSQQILENHLSNRHQISGTVDIQEKYLNKFGKLCTLSRTHECYLCNKIVKHEYKSIFHHLYKHQIDLETYTNTFKSHLLSELKEKNMGYIVDKDEKLSKAPNLDEFLETNVKSDDDELMENWADCSQHSCAICGQLSWSNLRFHWHIKREHGLLSTRDYRRQHGDPEVVLRQHKCHVCGASIKWEASRIRDHLKSHKQTTDKLSLKEYAKKYRDYILPELKRIKMSKLDPSHEEESRKLYNVDEWKSLFSKKCFPSDKVECDICKKVVTRHSMKHHLNRHKGILNMREFKRIKIKQLQLASNGVVKSLKELMAEIGADTVMRGTGEHLEVLDITKEDKETKLNMLQSGLSHEEIEQKIELLNSGLSITKSENVYENSVVVDTDQKEDREHVSVDCDPINVNDSGETVTSYIVDNESGEILIVPEQSEMNENFDDVEIEVIEDEEEELDAFETGPLDGRIMEIDVTPDEKAIKNDQSNTADVKIIMLREEFKQPQAKNDNEMKESENLDEESNTMEEEVNVIVVEDSVKDAEVITSDIIEQAEPVQEPEEDNNVVFLNSKDMGSVQFVVAESDEIIINQDNNIEADSVDKTGSLINKFLYVSADGQVVLEQEPKEDETSFLKSSSWKQLGSDEEYKPKTISKPVTETNGHVSEGTVVCQYTKLAGERVRVSTSKLITPSLTLLSEKDGVDEDISGTLLYSSGRKVYRDVGSQITSHRVNGVPTNKDEEQVQADTIRKFIESGGVLDKTCPGCGKNMSRQRNLISHIQVIHKVEVEGAEKEEHLARYSRENVRVSCEHCSKIVSRKSIKRHMKLCHSNKMNIE